MSSTPQPITLISPKIERASDDDEEDEDADAADLQVEDMSRQIASLRQELSEAHTHIQTIAVGEQPLQKSPPHNQVSFTPNHGPSVSPNQLLQSNNLYGTSNADESLLDRQREQREAAVLRHAKKRLQERDLRRRNQKVERSSGLQKTRDDKNDIEDYGDDSFDFGSDEDSSFSISSLSSLIGQQKAKRRQQNSDHQPRQDQTTKKKEVENFVNNLQSSNIQHLAQNRTHSAEIVAVKLRDEVSALRKKVENSRRVQESLEEENYKLKSQTVVAKNKISSLRIKLQSANATIATLKTNLQRVTMNVNLQNENDDEHARVSEMLRQSRKELRVKGDLVETLKAENRALQISLDRAKDENIVGEETQQTLEKIQRVSELKMTQMASQYNADLQSMSSDLTSANEENEHLREKIKKKKEVLSKQRELLLNLSTEKAGLVAQIADIDIDVVAVAGQEDKMAKNGNDISDYANNNEVNSNDLGIDTTDFKTDARTDHDTAAAAAVAAAAAAEVVVMV